MFLQRALQTHVSTPDVVGCLQTQKTSGVSHGAASKPDHISFSEATGREDLSFENERETVAEPVNVHVDLSQVGSNPTAAQPAARLSQLNNHGRMMDLIWQTTQIGWVYFTCPLVKKRIKKCLERGRP